MNSGTSQRKLVTRIYHGFVRYLTLSPVYSIHRLSPTGDPVPLGLRSKHHTTFRGLPTASPPPKIQCPTATPWAAGGLEVLGTRWCSAAAPYTSPESPARVSNEAVNGEGGVEFRSWTLGHEESQRAIESPLVPARPEPTQHPRSAPSNVPLGEKSKK